MVQLAEYVTLPDPLQYSDLLQIAYWLSSYPIGELWGVIKEDVTYSGFSADVIKSRVQLRQVPPTGKPWQYMNNEIRMIISESGM